MIDAAHQRSPELLHTTNITSANRHFSKFFIDLKYLWLEQMLEIRTGWYWYAIFSVFLPITMVFGFARIGSGLKDSDSLLYIMSGAAIFAVANDSLYWMAIRIGSMKKEGMLTYYASLPISKIAFLIAIIFSRLLVTLPGMIVPIVFGKLIYNVDIHLSPWVLVLLPLTALALSTIGMAIGVLVDSLDIINMIVNILIFVLIMAAPVFIPMNALPLPLQVLAYLLPPSYAADGLRQALSGSMGVTFYVDLGILTAMTIASFAILNHWLSWRQK